ncbi:helix-turn-helix domain-containing protein [Candidatus Galacturonibacter soehngenii]|uniref:Helix-turn-helix transcriptional regulator n=1 Tax=Candidatus Galacturonatibacter soehngenii TaxID=2307010 RepID=A0A7V7QP11_9FIRM|nr:helix-turn-helix transcriptional regulator [Candidatus Galacturonibacter soehngenii]MBA4688734.1 helix-turn-helix transcriptional regulator [Candidatus Galacturonibacter soehngenii]
MYENFERIIRERGITSYRVAKDTGIAQSCLSDWKHRRSIPRVDKLIKIAAYLDISLEELVQEKGEKNGRNHSKRIR